MKYPFLYIAIIAGVVACNNSSENVSDDDNNTHDSAGQVVITNSDLIVGEWQMEGMDLDMSDTLMMSEEDKVIARKDQKALYEELEEYKNKMQLVFSEGGYTFFQPTDTVRGKWSILADTVLEFRITGFEGYPQYAAIKGVNDSLLHMYDSNVRGTLHFKRIK